MGTRIINGGMKKMTEWIRHGDVIIEKVEEVKGKQTKTTQTILAEGEVTGHFHKLSCKSMLVSEYEGNKYLEIKQDAVLEHQEHDTLQIPTGKYKVYIQREVDLLGQVRQVMDWLKMPKNIAELIQKIVKDEDLDLHTKSKALVFVSDYWETLPTAKHLQGKEYITAVYNKAQRTYQAYYDRFKRSWLKINEDLIVTKITTDLLIAKMKIDFDLVNRLTKEDKNRIIEDNYNNSIAWLKRNFKIEKIGDLTWR
jgi:hypothetical protein